MLLSSSFVSQPANLGQSERIAEVLGKIGEAAIPELLKLVEHADSYMRWKVALALDEIGIEAVIPWSLKRLEDSHPAEHWRAAKALGNVAKKQADAIAPHLPHLLTLIPTDSGEDAYRVILAIQENCKYYNYEVYQAYLEAQKVDRQQSQNSDRPSSNIYINQLGILNTGDTTIHGDQIGEQHNHP